MFDVMEWESLTTDERERQLISDERLIARLRARQLRNLAELDGAQVATADGARSLSEWTAARLDVSVDTARPLVRTMRRIQDRPDLEDDLAAGDTSIDRIEAVSRIPENVGLMEHLNVAGVYREAARRARFTAQEEHRMAADQFLVLQPSLDESWWKIWGGLDGPAGAAVDQALTVRADELSPLPDGSKGNLSWRKAVALTELCVSGEAPPAQVTVFVDANEATVTNGETGVVLDAGVRVGRSRSHSLRLGARSICKDGRRPVHGLRAQHENRAPRPETSPTAQIRAPVCG